MHRFPKFIAASLFAFVAFTLSAPSARAATKTVLVLPPTLQMHTTTFEVEGFSLGAPGLPAGEALKDVNEATIHISSLTPSKAALLASQQYLPSLEIVISSTSGDVVTYIFEDVYLDMTPNGGQATLLLQFGSFKVVYSPQSGGSGSGSGGCTTYDQQGCSNS